jgi:protein-S-isoprenylcysteine O-methyltransferase Ste14
MRKTLYLKIAQQFLLFPLLMGALVFLPAGTFDYWEAWVFSAVFFACSCAITIWLVFHDPKLLERRMKAGPAAEKERTQKTIMIFAFLSFAAAVVVPALDHRFGWSAVPASIAILGNVLIVLSYVGFYFVFRENTYGAATIQVESDQKVISTGPYAVVRHPMYTGALVMTLGMPLALGSWWGLLVLVPCVVVLVWRLLDEERLLAKNLRGYADYQRQVRFRLIPGIF